MWQKIGYEDIAKILNETASSVGGGSMSGVCLRLFLRGHGLSDLINVKLIEGFFVNMLAKIQLHLNF